MSTTAVLPSFSSCWLAALSNDRGAWTLLSASLLLVYGYALSNRKFLWNLLLINGITGACGIIIQTCYKAVHIDADQLSDSNRACNNLFPGAQLQILMGINEIFWYLNETTTVLYSFFKVETVTTVTLPRKIGIALRGLMAAFCLAYLPLRIYIGYLRVSRNAYWDGPVGTAHGYAFITWGLAEIVIIAMLIQAAIYAKSGQRTFGSVISTVCSSSILRLFIISLNQVSIAFVATLPKPLDANGNRTQDSANFENVLWLIRGVYPMIMLFDILSTQSLLVERSQNSHRSQTERSNGAKNLPTSTYEFPSAVSVPTNTFSNPVDIPLDTMSSPTTTLSNLESGSSPYIQSATYNQQYRTDYRGPVNSRQN